MDPRYLVVFGACLTQFTVIGFFVSYALFVKVFEDEFGWSRAYLSTCIALGVFMMGTMAIVAGRLNDRYGPRIVLGVAGVLYGVGILLMSQITAPWELLVICGVFIGIGLSSHDVVTLSTIARWFQARRGVMSGVIKVGTAVGQFVVPLAAAALIVALGWREALLALGAGAIALLVIAALSMSVPKRVDPAQGPSEVPGTPFAEARRGRIFWTLCLMQALFFPTLMTVPTHLVAHGTDLGMGLEAAASLLSVMAVASIAGRLIVGGSSDRIGGRNAYVLCFVPLIASLAALVYVDIPWVLYGVIALYGFGHGGFFTVVSPTVAGYFGLRAHGAIFGVVLFCGTIGGSIGPILAGRVFDVTGSYQLAFSLLTAMAGLGLVLSLTLPRRT